MRTRSKPFHYHPASLILLSAGISLSEIADILEVSVPTVSRWLSGQNQAHPDLIATIRALAGPDVAREIAELVKRDEG